MSIGITDEHRELARNLAEWASGADVVARVRAAEEDAAATFDDVWKGLVELGVPGIGLAEEAGGGGGTMLDVGVALEGCARAMVPGPLLGSGVGAALSRGSAVSARRLAKGAGVAVAPTPSLSVSGDRLHGELGLVWDAVGVGQVLAGSRAGDSERWFLVPVEHARLSPACGPDLAHRAGTATVDAPLSDVVELTGVDATWLLEVSLALAAAEASGIARWCLMTAVEHAKVRVQFGAPIGSFQAVKHLCAEMLETAEAVTASAWDALSALEAGPGEQASYAARVAGVVALEGAVDVAQTCIQVLGGIGFTFEHDAHLYLRRALALRQLLGSADTHAVVLARSARYGVRRRLSVDLDGRDTEVRFRVREEVERIAALGGDERRTALADSGMLAPHWPAPYGMGADAVTQVVVDQELAAAGLERPDLKIGAWAIPTILEYGTDAQRERFVRPTLYGELVWCQLFSEPEAGSDLASLRTRAERVDGGWRLTGQKVWTSLAREADWAICLARTNPEAPSHRGITYFLVDMTSPGIDVRPLREMTGDALFNEVFLDGVVVPDDCVVGEVDQGWRLARTTLANERVAIASSRLGVATEGAVALLDDDSSPTDLARVGRAVALATVCAQLGARTTLKALDGAGPGAESSVAKLLGVRSRQDASELWLELLGPRALLGGPAAEAAAHEALLTRCLSIAGGTTQVLRNVAAERILGLPR